MYYLQLLEMPRGGDKAVERRQRGSVVASGEELGVALDVDRPNCTVLM